jgi:hypothetical protein
VDAYVDAPMGDEERAEILDLRETQARAAARAAAHE